MSKYDEGQAAAVQAVASLPEMPGDIHAILLKYSENRATPQEAGILFSWLDANGAAMDHDDDDLNDWNDGWVDARVPAVIRRFGGVQGLTRRT